MRVGKYEIYRGDERNVVISDVAKHQETGEPYLCNHKYYSTWETALVRVLDLSIHGADFKSTLKEIKDAKEEIIKELKVLQKSHKI